MGGLLEIREINPSSETEICLVATRMRQTLVEVLGEEKGTALYTMDWLLNRVRWHLDPARSAKIFLVESPEGTIVAHAIARVDEDEVGGKFGYFSTLFVVPTSRSQGIATRLILHVEAWLKGLGLSRITYNTAANHALLIRLFERQGFQITHREAEMVQLTKQLP